MYLRPPYDYEVARNPKTGHPIWDLPDSLSTPPPCDGAGRPPGERTPRRKPQIRPSPSGEGGFELLREDGWGMVKRPQSRATPHFPTLIAARSVPPHKDPMGSG